MEFIPMPPLSLEASRVSLGAWSIRWVLDQPGVSVALWGAHQPGQLDPLDEVFGWKLDAAALAKIDRINAETGTGTAGPEFLIPPKGTTVSS